MERITLKKVFEENRLAESYTAIVRSLGKEPTSGDEFADAILLLRRQEDGHLYEICQIVARLFPEDYFDELKYLIVQYEAKGRYAETKERIELLTKMMEYSYIKEYVVELACLYMTVGNTSRARRIVMNSASSFDEFPEKNIILEDIKNGTENYQKLLCPNQSHCQKAKESSAQKTEEPSAQKAKVPSAQNAMEPSAQKAKEPMPMTTVSKPFSQVASKSNKDEFIQLHYDDSLDDTAQDCPEFIREKFAEQHLSGMRKVKEQLTKLYNLLRVENMRKNALGVENTSPKGLNFILYGNPGTGKTSVARIIGELLYQMGLVQENHMIETDRSGLVDSVIGGTEKKTMQVLEKARGKTLFIDEAYTLYNEKSETDFGRVAIDLLLKDIEDHRGEYCVILAGYQQQMEKMIKKANRGFASRFDYKIDIPDYSSEELVNIIVKMAEAKHYKISAMAKNAIVSRIDKEKIDETFDNARFMRRLLDSAIEKQSLRLVAANGNLTENDLCYLLKDDFLSEKEAGQNENEQDVDHLTELDHLIGLEGVKKEVHLLEQTARIIAEQKRRGMKTAATGTLHLAFTGNPGTGKTTVARLLAKIYNQLGLLKRRDVFVECGRAQLVGSHVGETAIKVVDMVNSALGGVLFIDEVYNLVNGENDTFGMEALNTLIAEMENHADKFMVIIAGYTREVRDFMRKNPGMESRISNIIEFADYTVEEMVRIFRHDIKKRGLDDSALRDEAIYALIDSKCHVENFGNGRGVRNICDAVVRRHNSRLSGMADLSTISDSDFITLQEEDLNF